MKQVLFNAEMVRALLMNQKTETRRIMKPKFRDDECGFQIVRRKFDGAFVRVEITDENEFPTREMQSPYKPGDILYVRETWSTQEASQCIGIMTGNCPHKDCESADGPCFGYEYIYKAELQDHLPKVKKWHPSIHMPKEAARIFLMVKDVFAQKIQKITDEQARAEGCKDRDDFSRVWNKCYTKPQPMKKGGVIVRYESYPWEDIQETRTYRGLPWLVIGNPWVWVIEFERISKEEALKYE